MGFSYQKYGMQDSQRAMMFCLNNCWKFWRKDFPEVSGSCDAYNKAVGLAVKHPDVVRRYVNQYNIDQLYGKLNHIRI